MEIKDIANLLEEKGFWLENHNSEGITYGFENIRVCIKRGD